MTFKSYKGRSLVVGQPVKVYRNLHKKTYSIVDIATGLVVGYADTVRLQHANFKVNEAGRQRVLREKHKNVHAYVTGTFVSTQEHAERHEATYNPYKYETFVRRDASGNVSGAIYSAASVTLSPRGIGYTGREEDAQ